MKAFHIARLALVLRPHPTQDASLYFVEARDLLQKAETFLKQCKKPSLLQRLRMAIGNQDCADRA